ncbi:choice-of-anchor G family protein [uncultured Jatrophihabitans sp.]|uniref:choice-of-anchor G family protein n=1 Tax=uncultured Jatrophihabitans sp. TaxID=1610747 RepID=UPI0035CAE03D
MTTSSPVPVRPRRRLVRLTAAGVTLGVAAAAIVGSTGANAAAKPVSQSEGRFLTGTAAGQSFDSVAALEGENAAYPGNPGPNANDLKGSVLGMALAGPTKNISVPFPGGITFGTVGQYASASSNGSATASSGLIGSNGDINVAGSGNDDFATIDLANLPGASTLTDTLGGLKLKIGAVSSQARQAAFGKKLADPSVGCTGGTYSRVSNSDQAGSYQFANLTLSATSPLLSALGTALTGTLGTLSTAFSNAVGSTGGAVTVTGLPTAGDLQKDFTVSLADGGITASLTDGSLKIDLAKILEAAGLDLDNLCPNTSLVSYLADALSKLPAALGEVISGAFTTITKSFKNVVIKVGGVALPSSSALTTLFTDAGSALSTNASQIGSTFDSSFQPALDAITNNLLDLTANAQDETDGVFTEAALVLKLIPNGGSLPTIPGLPTSGLPGLPNIPGVPTGVIPQAKARAAKPSSKPSGSASPHSFSTVRLTSVREAAPAAARPVQAAPTSSAVLQLNLALSAVANSAPSATSPTTGTTTAPNTAIPTGVPAGAAGHHGGGSPALPIVLVLVGLVLAGGGVTAYRVRGRFGH